MKKFILLFFCCCLLDKTFAQKALQLSDCENLFRKNNLILLQEHYNIDAAKAALIQARIWEQPYVSAEANAFNPLPKKYFDIGKQGQKAASVEQLIYLGGKKSKEIKWSKSNIALAEITFEQTLIDLKMQLRQAFYTLFFDQQQAYSLSNQLAHIDSLANSYALQEKKGNIPLKDVVRLQSLALSLRNEWVNIQKDIAIQNELLKILTGTTNNIVTTILPNELNEKLEKQCLYNQSQLFERAVTNNPSYKKAQLNTENKQLNWQWQKSLAIPDLKLGANYDQRGGAFNNQVNFTLGIPLPLWNNNKGNIKIAATEMKQSALQEQQIEIELNAKIASTLQNLLVQQNQYQQISKQVQNFEQVYEGVLFNFQKRNISMMEFTDYMESFNQTQMFINETKKQIFINGELLNALINETIF